MKIALLGNGKTGSFVQDLHEHVTAFNSTNLCTLNKISGHDVIISFLPGEVFNQYIPLFLESKIPLLSGSTGRALPSFLDKELKKMNLTWLVTQNFSMGIQIFKAILPIIKNKNYLMRDVTISLNEIHHTKKKDSPSGTALSLKKWLEMDIPITSQRKNDDCGTHTMTIETPSEVLTISHHAKDRSLFAKGAITAAKYFTQSYQSLPKGLITLSDLLLLQEEQNACI